MPRRGTSILALAALVVAGFLAGCGAEDVRQSSGVRDQEETGQQTVRQADERGNIQEAEETAGTTVGKSLAESRCLREREGELRIGDFSPPEEDVPAYEIIEEKPVERDGAKAARLLVDTRATGEADYALITRDIKSRRKELDAASIEFTDTTGAFSRNGTASIFNTPCGSDFIGYVYRPPNNEGYNVTATAK